MKRRPHPRRLVALHEAGHAVVMLARGSVLNFVTIVPDTGRGEDGRCEPLPLIAEEPLVLPDPTRWASTAKDEGRACCRVSPTKQVPEPVPASARYPLGDHGTHPTAKPGSRSISRHPSVELDAIGALRPASRSGGAGHSLSIKNILRHGI